jgi:hypothetical protein
MFLLIRRILIPVMGLFLSINLFSQSTANANISATVTDVIGATNLSEIYFEKSVVRSRSTSVELNSEYVAEKPTFIIVGNDYSYAITFPTFPVILKRVGSNETIKANFFIINSSKSANRDANLNISLSLTLQPATYYPGYYLSVNPIPVTVNYN